MKPKVPLRKQCRRMVSGYGPCYLKNGHRGGCLFPEGAGVQAGTTQTDRGAPRVAVVRADVYARNERGEFIFEKKRPRP